MVACKKIIITKPKICIGDLNKKIIVYTRPINAPFRNSTDITYDYVEVARVWASIQSIQGDFLIDGVARNDVPTDKIYIRYRDDISSINWLAYNGHYYNILRSQNINGYNDYLSLLCVNTGSITKVAASV